MLERGASYTMSVLRVQVMPYSTGLSTPLANFEANQNYKDTMDPSVMVGTTSWDSRSSQI